MVDFPLPLGPIRTVVFPGANFKLVGDNAATESKHLLTRTNSMMAGPARPVPLSALPAESNTSPARPPDIVDSVLARSQVLHAEPAPFVAPMADDLETSAGSHSAKVPQSVFI